MPQHTLARASPATFSRTLSRHLVRLTCSLASRGAVRLIAYILSSYRARPLPRGGSRSRFVEDSFAFAGTLDRTGDATAADLIESLAALLLRSMPSGVHGRIAEARRPSA